MEWGERSSYESKELKLKREIAGEIRCSRCPYHRRENARRKQKPDEYKNIKRESIKDIPQIDSISDKTCIYLVNEPTQAEAAKAAISSHLLGCRCYWCRD